MTTGSGRCAGPGISLLTMSRRALTILLLVLGCALFPATPLVAQCATEPPLRNYTGGGTSACPCFVPGEQAGAILNAPAGHYPIEILRIGIGWGSAFGGAFPSVERSIHVYGAGLPNPGSPIFTLPAPQLNDGFINEFNIEPLPGAVIVPSGPFAVTLEFENPNAGDFFAPTMVTDGNGCQPGRNVVFASPGTWRDACALMVTGDWVVYVIYRPVSCSTGVGSVPDGDIVPGIPLMVETAPAGAIALTWSDSCAAGDTDYAIYEGTLGSYYSHTALMCTTSGGTSITFIPSPGSTYYLIVPTNGSVEGAPGFDSAGMEIPAGASQCLPSAAPTCP